MILLLAPRSQLSVCSRSPIELFKDHRKTRFGQGGRSVPCYGYSTTRRLLASQEPSTLITWLLPQVTPEGAAVSFLSSELPSFSAIKRLILRHNFSLACCL